MPTLLLLLLACTGKTEPPLDTPADHSADPSDDSAPVERIDADADGAPVAEDCDDSDPSRYPGAQELCDGVDQDCDAAIDEGVPSDGRGCADPGRPARPAQLEILHITTRTGDNTTNGTDEAMEACVGEGLCYSLNKPEWNDLEVGELDVIAYEGLNIDLTEIDRFTVQTSGGADQWRPSCFQVSLDGELVYCRAVEDLPIGNDSGELTSWTDPEGLGLGCQTCFDSPLTHGPMLGPLSPTTAKIWMRLDSTRRVSLRLSTTTAGLATAPELAVAYPAAADDFTHLAQVQGLTPDTTWHYLIEVDGEALGPWSFTTPPEQQDTLRFAFGSCTKDDEQPIFGAVAALNPDVFLFIGDNHYGNTSDLSALRQYYRWAHERPLRRELMQQTQILATWDDHDFTGNNTDGREPGRDVALRGFGEYWANGSYGADGVAGVFSRHRLGPVELFLLDDRYHRGNDGSLLGQAQAAWLIAALAESEAPFKLLASGSQFTQEGSSDSWASFPEAYEALLEDIVAQQVTGVVLLSGDIHRSELRWLEGAAGGYALPELTSSPMGTWNSSCGSDGELVACFDDGTSFIVVDVDASVEDPSLVAVILDEAGGVQGRIEASLSALSFP